MIDIKVDNTVFYGFLFYTGVLVLKTMLMSLLTSRMRFKKRVWSSPEDIDAAIKLKIPSPSLKYDDEHVERVRRAHLNDLENIPMFVFSGFVYTLSQPNPTIALTLFRIYALTRILHTLVYAIYVIPQPARAIFHFIGYFIAIYMTLVGIGFQRYSIYLFLATLLKFVTIWPHLVTFFRKDFLTKIRNQHYNIIE